MRPARDKLTPGEWALLGLLDQRPAHGFALARALSPGGEVGRVWSMQRTMVYGALGNLERRALVQPKATVPSDLGPRRTILEISESGTVALNEWLIAPVQRVRDARSLLMLKILFLIGRVQDVTPLLINQRQVLTAQADRLASAAASATGYDRALLLWRLHGTKAVIEFTDAMLSDPTTTNGNAVDNLLSHDP